MKKKYKKIPVSEFISEKKLKKLQKIIEQTCGDVNRAYDEIEDVLSKDFSVKDLGTNRLIFLSKNKKYKDLIFKVAGDSHGIEANFREFYNGDLDSKLTYSYSISKDGIFMVQERVKPFTSETMEKRKKDVRKMLKSLEDKILLVDCKLKNFKNFGLRDNGEVCLLDHGDTVPLANYQSDNTVNMDEEMNASLRCKQAKTLLVSGKKLKQCGGKLEYSKNYDFLQCKKCGKTMSVNDAYREFIGDKIYSGKYKEKKFADTLDFDPYEFQRKIRAYAEDTMSKINNKDNENKGDALMTTKIINGSTCRQLKGYWIPEEFFSSKVHSLRLSSIKTGKSNPAEFLEMVGLNPTDYKVMIDDHTPSKKNKESWDKGIKLASKKILNIAYKYLDSREEGDPNKIAIPYEVLNKYAQDGFVIDSKAKEKAIYNNLITYTNVLNKVIYTVDSFIIFLSEYDEKGKGEFRVNDKYLEDLYSRENDEDDSQDDVEKFNIQEIEDADVEEVEESDEPDEEESDEDEDNGESEEDVQSIDVVELEDTAREMLLSEINDALSEKKEMVIDKLGLVAKSISFKEMYEILDDVKELEDADDSIASLSRILEKLKPYDEHKEVLSDFLDRYVFSHLDEIGYKYADTYIAKEEYIFSKPIEDDDSEKEADEDEAEEVGSDLEELLDEMDDEYEDEPNDDIDDIDIEEVNDLIDDIEGEEEYDEISSNVEDMSSDNYDEDECAIMENKPKDSDRDEQIFNAIFTELMDRYGAKDMPTEEIVSIFVSSLKSMMKLLSYDGNNKISSLESEVLDKNKEIEYLKDRLKGFEERSKAYDEMSEGYKNEISKLRETVTDLKAQLTEAQNANDSDVITEILELEDDFEEPKTEFKVAHLKNKPVLPIQLDKIGDMDMLICTGADSGTGERSYVYVGFHELKSLNGLEPKKIYKAKDIVL
jgi:hypothetical protein